jgi:hypothetical protein
MIYPHQNSDGHPVNYVVGMNWRTLITSGDNSAKALKISKDARATHYVFDGFDRAVGYIKIPKIKRSPGAAKSKDAKKVRDGSHLFSLAHAVAKAYPNSAWLMELPNTGDSEGRGYYWSCLCKNGSPISGSDRLLTDGDIQAFLESNKSFLDELSENQLRTSLNISHAAAYQTTFDSDLGALNLGNSELLLVNKGSFQFLRGPKGKYWLGAAGLLACVFAYQQYTAWQEAQASKLILLENAKDVSSNDPVMLYQKALGQWRNEQVAANYESMREAHTKILSTPMQVADWSMTGITCSRTNQAAGAVAGQKEAAKTSLWGCAARYTRPAYPARSNQDFISAAPKDWVLSWEPLNTAIAKFSVKTDAAALADEQMITPANYQTEFLSEYQLISKAFMSLEIPTLVPIKLPEIKRPDGTKFIPPPEMDGKYLESTIKLAGPLRSMEILPTTNVSWNKLSVDVTSVESTLQNSKLNAVYTGKIYAKNQ